MLIVFDTETTDLTKPEATPLKQQPHIIELAAIKLDSNLKEIDRIQFLCNPGMQISKEITDITKLTNEDLVDQLPFAKHYRDLVEFFLGSKFLLAHNLGFDRDMLKYELMRMDMLTRFPWPPGHRCTVELTYHLNGFRLNMQKLHELCHGKGFKDGHRAMVDVEALVSCLPYLKKKGILKC